MSEEYNAWINWKLPCDRIYKGAERAILENEGKVVALQEQQGPSRVEFYGQHLNEAPENVLGRYKLLDGRIVRHSESSGLYFFELEQQPPDAKEANE